MFVIPANELLDEVVRQARGLSDAAELEFIGAVLADAVIEIRMEAMRRMLMEG